MYAIYACFAFWTVVTFCVFMQMPLSNFRFKIINCGSKLLCALLWVLFLCNLTNPLIALFVQRYSVALTMAAFCGIIILHTYMLYRAKLVKEYIDM